MINMELSQKQCGQFNPKQTQRGQLVFLSRSLFESKRGNIRESKRHVISDMTFFKQWTYMGSSIAPIWGLIYVD